MDEENRHVIRVLGKEGSLLFCAGTCCLVFFFFSFFILVLWPREELGQDPMPKGPRCTWVRQGFHVLCHVPCFWKGNDGFWFNAGIHCTEYVWAYGQLFGIGSWQWVIWEGGCFRDSRSFWEFAARRGCARCASRAGGCGQWPSICRWEARAYICMYVCVPTGWMGRRRSVLVGGTRGREEYNNGPESCEEFYFAKRLMGVGAAIWR